MRRLRTLPRGTREQRGAGCSRRLLSSGGDGGSGGGSERFAAAAQAVLSPASRSPRTCRETVALVAEVAACAPWGSGERLRLATEWVGRVLRRRDGPVELCTSRDVASLLHAVVRLAPVAGADAAAGCLGALLRRLTPAFLREAPPGVLRDVLRLEQTAGVRLPAPARAAVAAAVLDAPARLFSQRRVGQTPDAPAEACGLLLDALQEEEGEEAVATAVVRLQAALLRSLRGCGGDEGDARLAAAAYLCAYPAAVAGRVRKGSVPRLAEVAEQVAALEVGVLGGGGGGSPSRTTRELVETRPAEAVLVARFLAACVARRRGGGGGGGGGDEVASRATAALLALALEALCVGDSRVWPLARVETLLWCLRTARPPGSSGSDELLKNGQVKAAVAAWLDGAAAHVPSPPEGGGGGVLPLHRLTGLLVSAAAAGASVGQLDGLCRAAAAGGLVGMPPPTAAGLAVLAEHLVTRGELRMPARSAAKMVFQYEAALQGVLLAAQGGGGGGRGGGAPSFRAPSYRAAQPDVSMATLGLCVRATCWLTSEGLPTGGTRARLLACATQRDVAGKGAAPGQVREIVAAVGLAAASKHRTNDLHAFLSYLRRAAASGAAVAATASGA